MSLKMQKTEPEIHSGNQAAQHLLGERLGRKIKECRLALGLTPKEFADDIGCTTSYVLRLEEGSLDPQLRLIEKCADVFGIELSELIGAAMNEIELCIFVEEER